MEQVREARATNNNADYSSCYLAAYALSEAMIVTVVQMQKCISQTTETENTANDTAHAHCQD